MEARREVLARAKRRIIASSVAPDERSHAAGRAVSPIREETTGIRPGAEIAAVDFRNAAGRERVSRKRRQVRQPFAWPMKYERIRRRHRYP